MSNFVEMCLAGEASPDEIDDFVDRWHDDDSAQQLYQFLGMTREEYALWVADPDILSFILKAHRENKNISMLIQETPDRPYGLDPNNNE